MPYYYHDYIFHYNICTEISTLHVSINATPAAVTRLRVHHVSTDLRLTNPYTVISSLETSDPSQPHTTPDNVLAYRPNFANNSIGTFFINLETIFPCYHTWSNQIAPPCQMFTFEEYPYILGTPCVQASDIGTNFNIFNDSRNIATYGFGFMGCSEINAAKCASNRTIHTELMLVCLLPPALNECAN